MNKSVLLVVVNKTTSTAASDILELKCDSTNSENALNVMSENMFCSGLAETVGKNPIRSILDKQGVNRLPSDKRVIQKTRQTFFRQVCREFIKPLICSI